MNPVVQPKGFTPNSGQTSAEFTASRHFFLHGLVRPPVPQVLVCLKLSARLNPTPSPKKSPENQTSPTETNFSQGSLLLTPIGKTINFAPTDNSKTRP